MIHSRLLNVRILYADMRKLMLDVLLNLHEISGLKILKTTGLSKKIIIPATCFEQTLLDWQNQKAFKNTNIPLRSNLNHLGFPSSSVSELKSGESTAKRNCK